MVARVVYGWTVIQGRVLENLLFFFGSVWLACLLLVCWCLPLFSSLLLFLLSSFFVQVLSCTESI